MGRGYLLHSPALAAAKACGSGFVATILGIGLVIVPLPTYAQSVADTLEVLRGAVLYMKGDLGATSVSVDSALEVARLDAHNIGVRQIHTAGVMQALSELPGIKLSSLASTRQCESRSPSSCKLVGADALVGLTDPIFVGNEARVRVNSKFQSRSKRQPVASRDVLVYFERIGDRWKVTKVVTLRES